MRIRTIKPEFWSHPILSREADDVRLCAIGLLNISDDEGYFLASPALVRSSLWPLDEDSTRARRCLVKLSQVDYIELREHPTHGQIGLVVNFAKHQRVDRPRASSLKAYFLDDQSSNVRRLIDDHSCQEWNGMEQGMEGKGKEHTHLVNFPAHEPSAVDQRAVAGASEGPEVDESEAVSPSPSPNRYADPDLATEPPPGMAGSPEEAFSRTPIELQESLGRDLIVGVWEELRSTGWMNRHGVIVRSWGAHIRSVGPLIKKHIINAKTAGKGLPHKVTSGPKSVGELLAERILREDAERKNGKGGV